VFEKIMIVIAVIAFFVPIIISQPYIAVYGAVIILALTLVIATKEKRVQKLLKKERIKFQKREAQLLNEEERILSGIFHLISTINESEFHDFSPEKKEIYTKLIIKIVIKADDQDICLSCARVISKMGTAYLVEETIEKDKKERMNDKELGNLLELSHAIDAIDIEELSKEQIPEEDEEQ